jgi:hypothetical protein
MQGLQVKKNICFLSYHKKKEIKENKLIPF